MVLTQNAKNNPQPKLLNYPCSPKDQNTLLTRKPKKLHPKINNHTETHINTYKTHIKQIKIKYRKIGMLHSGFEPRTLYKLYIVLTN